MNKESFDIEKIESSSHQIHCMFCNDFYWAGKTKMFYIRIPCYSFPICEKCLAKIRGTITDNLYPELKIKTLWDMDTGDGDKAQNYGGLQNR